LWAVLLIKPRKPWMSLLGFWGHGFIDAILGEIRRKLAFYIKQVRQKGFGCDPFMLQLLLEQ
jgi:hypothetical protein